MMRFVLVSLGSHECSKCPFLSLGPQAVNPLEL
jgi:hypothetical protein